MGCANVFMIVYKLKGSLCQLLKTPKKSRVKL